MVSIREGSGGHYRSLPIGHRRSLHESSLVKYLHMGYSMSVPSMDSPDCVTMDSLTNYFVN